MSLWPMEDLRLVVALVDDVEVDEAELSHDAGRYAEYISEAAEGARRRQHVGVLRRIWRPCTSTASCGELL
jgi:hypothetical protein